MADTASHVPAGATPVVLFPGHGARPLTPELVAPLPSPPIPDRAFAVVAMRRNDLGHRTSTYESNGPGARHPGGRSPGPLFDFYPRATDGKLLVRGSAGAFRAVAVFQ